MTKGWKLESARHSLARKGIETGRKIKAKWAKFKEKREFEKSPIGKLTKLIERMDKLGYTDEEMDAYIRSIKLADEMKRYDLVESPEEFLKGWRESGEREKEFKKMEKQKEKFDLAKEKFAKEKGRKPTTEEEDEILTKILEEG